MMHLDQKKEKDECEVFPRQAKQVVQVEPCTCSAYGTDVPSSTRRTQASSSSLCLNDWSVTAIIENYVLLCDTLSKDEIQKIKKGPLVLLFLSVLFLLSLQSTEYVY